MNQIFIVLLLVGLVSSWSGPSHIIIYMIARKEIGQQQTALVDKILAVMPEPEVNYPNPYEIAMWPDDVGSDTRGNFKAWGGFHYYDQLFCDGIDPKKVTAIVDPEYNVVKNIISSLSTIRYKPPFPYHFDGHFEKSLALRFLIHMVGDMHQPLHSATRCTPARPQCDGGGNSFPVNGGPITKNLHALWDQAMGKIPFESRPLSKPAIERYQKLADQIMQQFPRASLAADLAEKDLWKIAKKHLDLAINYAYKGIHEGDTPSQEYLNSRFEVCKKQIALAGYRLADMLKEINFQTDNFN